MYQRILIAYDSSDEAQRALKEGLDLAARLGSRVTVVTVAEPLPGYYNIAAVVAPAVPDQLRREHLDTLAKLQTAATAVAVSHGVEIDTALLEADEVEGILRTAIEIRADLLVVGLHRHQQGLEWAGTVRRVANGTPCSILAVI